MPDRLVLPRSVLLVLAVLFAAFSALYSATWIYYSRWEPEAELGISFRYLPLQHAIHVTGVWSHSAARQAGLEPADRLTAVNARPLVNLNPYYDAVVRGQPGDLVRLTVVREGREAPLELDARLRPLRAEARMPAARALLVETLRMSPALFLVVAFGVLFLRLDDRNAWLLALLFAGFIGATPLLHAEGALPAGLRGPAWSYKVLFGTLTPAIFCYFFAVFPVRSLVDRRAPWLKHALLAVGALLAVPAAVLGLWEGSSRSMAAFLSLGGEFELRSSTTGALVMFRPGAPTVAVVGAYIFGGFLLGLASLCWTAFRAPSAEARRKGRVVLWGTLAGSVAAVLLLIGAAYTRRPYYAYPVWVQLPAALAAILLPLSFAYAVVKHRVLDIPILLKRSARYLLVQGMFAAVLLLLSVAMPLRLAQVAAQTFRWELEVAVPIALLLGVAVGILWVVGAQETEKIVRERIDRAFFRSAYDARQVLQDLAEKAGRVAHRPELASLLRHHVREALHPVAMAIYFAGDDGVLVLQGEAEGRWPASLPADAALLQELAAHGRPWEIPPPEEPLRPGLPQLAGLRMYLEQGRREATKENGLTAVLAASGAECLVPLVGREARLSGLLLLGPRLSEEPYSDEDERLLGSVASQAAIALENIGMAGKIAAQIEADRRARVELQVAKEVQGRLFPQTAPDLPSLEYTGLCIQARTVGGDYYDFLDLGGGRVGLVLADIAGKGISAALLMASLQANLRSLHAHAPENLARLLQSLNHLFMQNTGFERFATLFFGIYDDAARRLLYANCGHNPPLLLRGDGALEKLPATATVLGLFEPWECETAELELAPGDTLVVYSDGVPDAASDAGEMFGDGRLAEAVRAHAREPVPQMIQSLAETVQRFSGREQEDDLTLLVARVRSCPE